MDAHAYLRGLSPREKAELVEVFEQMFGDRLDEEIERLKQERRLFFLCEGAKSTVAALLEVDAIHPDYREPLRDWVEAGAHGRLRIRDVEIIPPEEA